MHLFYLALGVGIHALIGRVVNIGNESYPREIKRKRKRREKEREKKRETADRSFLLTFHHHRQTLKFHEVLKVDELLSWIRASWRTNSQLTMVENGKKHRQNSHPIIHCPTSERTSEWPSTPICILSYSGPQCNLISLL